MFGIVKSVFGGGKAQKQGEAIFKWALEEAQARFPKLFDGKPGQNDEIRRERFEILTLTMSVALWALHGQQHYSAAAQAAHDAMFQSFDHSMREGGIGDMAISHRIKKLASAFYGRLQTYTTALDSGDRNELCVALLRNQATSQDQAEDVAKWMEELATQLKQKDMDSWLKDIQKRPTAA